MSLALRGRPRLVMLDARSHPVAALKATERLKADSYTGIVPVVVYSADDDTSFAASFTATTFFTSWARRSMTLLSILRPVRIGMS